MTPYDIIEYWCGENGYNIVDCVTYLLVYSETIDCDGFTNLANTPLSVPTTEKSLLADKKLILTKALIESSTNKDILYGVISSKRHSNPFAYSMWEWSRIYYDMGVLGSLALRTGRGDLQRFVSQCYRFLVATVGSITCTEALLEECIKTPWVLNRYSDFFKVFQEYLDELEIVVTTSKQAQSFIIYKNTQKTKKTHGMTCTTADKILLSLYICYKYNHPKKLPIQLIPLAAKFRNFICENQEE